MPRFMRAVQATAEYWAWSIRLNNYFSAVGYAILFYDFSLTFSTEVEYFWKSANISLFSVLFAANRYFGLLGPIPTIFEYFTSPSEQSCRNLQVYHQAFAVASQATIAIILVLRTYALYERSGRILVLLIVTHVGGAIAALVMMITTESPKDIDTTLPFNFSGCDLSLTNGQSFHLAIAWFAMLWFDTTIFVLTLARAIQMHRRLPGGIVEILFRDGTIYYGIIVASTVTNIATFLATPSGSNLKGLETTLTNT
ncbi:hypothetical protein BD310DRAFT_911862 [Dichomitus squalens]|uniref:DUF6533 domain-containing protein n=1 Tax=Dichomitus squalens TaxID=114155 RepID=A0A4Q9QEA6_9APHY|nr:hypothetical protein BD310DRAFT_911862 [Dichomitus squalens]